MTNRSRTGLQQLGNIIALQRIARVLGDFRIQQRRSLHIQPLSLYPSSLGRIGRREKNRFRRIGVYSGPDFFPYMAAQGRIHLLIQIAAAAGGHDGLYRSKDLVVRFLGRYDAALRIDDEAVCVAGNLRRIQ